MKAPLAIAAIGLSFMAGAWVGHRGAMNSKDGWLLNVREATNGRPVFALVTMSDTGPGYADCLTPGVDGTWANDELCSGLVWTKLRYGK